MDLEALLTHYFGTVDLEGLTADIFDAGQQRLGIDFAVERDPGRRFALWTLMDAIGTAPLPADAFKKPEEAGLKRAAENYLTAAWRFDRDR